MPPAPMFYTELRLGRRLSSAHSPCDDLTVPPLNVVGEQLTKTLEAHRLLGPTGVLEERMIPPAELEATRYHQ